MPRHGKQQSPVQKLQTEKMRRRGLAIRSSQGESTIDAVDPRAALAEEQRRSMEQAKAHQQLMRDIHRQREKLRAKAHSLDEVITLFKDVGQDTEPSEGDRLFGS